MLGNKKNEKSHIGEHFLIIVAIVYLIMALLKLSVIISSLQFALKIFKNIMPILALVFVLLIIFNYIITPKQINRYLGQAAGFKKWIIAIVGGILSSGPVYMWYPILKELLKKGASYGFVSAFLYSRAIKLPLLPILIAYFGLKYTITLTMIMIVASIAQGLIFEKIKI